MVPRISPHHCADEQSEAEMTNRHRVYFLWKHSLFLGFFISLLLSASNLPHTGRIQAQSTYTKYADRVSLGESHACFVTLSGDVYCWGLNDMGQLGQGQNLAPAPYSTEVPMRVPLNTRAVQVAAGLDFTCVLDENGDIYCFGNAAFGRLGTGILPAGPEARPVPEQVLYSGDFVQVTAGSAHACGLRANGYISCWGWNAMGQVGPGGDHSQRFPLTITYSPGFVNVTAGWEHTCGLKAKRRVECWGANRLGQLGDGTVVSRSWLLPVLEATSQGPTQLEDVIEIEAGANHTCAIKSSGQVLCWGRTTSGQIGEGNEIVDPLVNVAFPNGLAGGARLGGGSRADHSCVIQGNGDALCWGRNDHGQVGVAPLSAEVSAPAGVQIPERVIEISSGENNTCALLVTGILKCWGYNQWGEVGNGSLTKNIVTPQSVVGVPSHLTGSATLALGFSHTCASKSDGTIYCWGSNTYGQLGDGTTTNTRAPALPVSYRTLPPLLLSTQPLFPTLPFPISPPTLVTETELGRATNLAVGTDFSCALPGDGSVRCWGKNNARQLGDGTTIASGIGVLVRDISSAIGIAVGHEHACALISDGTLRCWGANNYGQLGNGNELEQLAPVTSYADHVSKVVAGQNHTCALSYSGQVYCWGENTFGQLGDGTQTPNSTAVVVQIAPDTRLTEVTDLAAGDQFSCALRHDGTVWCWGRNLEGQLGDGTNTTTRVMAVRVQTTDNWPKTLLTAGGNHACAVGPTGAYCWGDNTYGQLGDATTTNSSTPVAVQSSAKIISLVAGHRHTCGFLTDGTIRCWGYNLFGQVGTGTASSYENLPVSVANFP
jgi:alpha-tubulin suppressor-like RCC1 family protein